MKKKSLGINAVLNVIKSCLGVLFPLITYPYAFRVIHADGIGKVNYSFSIVQYFSYIAMLGFSTYAIREGSKIREDKSKFYKFSNQIFTLNVISTFFSYVLLVILLLFCQPLNQYRGLILLISVSILFTTLGIDWINVIYEDYLIITIRAIVAQFLGLILLFVFVKDETDIYPYAFLTILTTVVTSVSNWFYCRKYVHIKLTFDINIKKHLTSVMSFFINNLAISIYVNADLTMLGWICGDYEVGMYLIAVKIYNVIKSVLAAFYAVTIPRLSFYAGTNDMDNFKQVITKLTKVLIILLVPVSVGLCCTSKEIINLMGGIEYANASFTLKILSISLIFAILGGIVVNCINIPIGREKINVKITIMSALVNIILNFYMIKKFTYNGAAITTLISELLVFIVSLISLKDVRKFIDMKSLRIGLFHSLIGGVSIILINIISKNIIENKLISFIVTILISIIVYVIELYLVKDETFIEYSNKIKRMGV